MVKALALEHLPLDPGSTQTYSDPTGNACCRALLLVGMPDTGSGSSEVSESLIIKKTHMLACCDADRSARNRTVPKYSDKQHAP